MRCKNCGWENPENKVKCEKCNAPLANSVGELNDSSSEKHKPKKTARGCPECGYPVREDDESCPRCGHLLGSAKQDTPVDEEPKPVESAKSTPVEIPQPVPEPTPVEIPQPALEPTPVEISQPASEPTPVEILQSVPKPTPVEIPQPAPEPTPEVREPVGKTWDITLNPWVRAEQIQSPKCSLTSISGNDEPTNDASLRFSGNVIQLNRGNTEPDNQTITSKTQAELSFENDKWYIQDKSALKTTYIYAGERKELKPGDIILLGNRLFIFDYVSANQPE